MFKFIVLYFFQTHFVFWMPHLPTMEVSDFAKHPLRGWIPTKLIIDKEVIACKWTYTKDFSFNLPFFDEAIQIFNKLPQNSTIYKVYSTIELLPEWSREIPTIPPAALIFHVSRCGSTLISQILGLNQQHISLSEVPLFDEILHFLDAAIKFYGANRNLNEERLFIKTDSWHLYFYQQYRKLFPNTPFIILYRQPGEVLDSNKRKKGIQGVPGMVEPTLLGLDANAPYFHHTDTYMPMVLEKFFEAILDIANNDRHTLLVNYNEGPMVIAERIIGFCGINADEEERMLIAQRTQHDAKYPYKKYQELNASNNDSANAARLLELYRQVDTLRLGQKFNNPAHCF